MQRHMDITKISIGPNVPEIVNAIIENPLGGAPVKYEIDKKSGAMVVDRFLHTSMAYPGNYGFVPHTLSGDGDPVDIMAVGRTPVIPGAIMAIRPLGVLVMEDEAGMDEKIIGVPAPQLHPFHDDIQSYTDLPEIVRLQITHFFEHYKDLEKGKWVKTVRWGDKAEAQQMILDGIERAKQTLK